MFLTNDITKMMVKDAATKAILQAIKQRVDVLGKICIENDIAIISEIIDDLTQYKSFIKDKNCSIYFIENEVKDGIQETTRNIIVVDNSNPDV